VHVHRQLELRRWGITQKGTNYKMAYATEVCVLCVKQFYLTGSVVAVHLELSMGSDCKQGLHWLTLRG